MAGGIYPKDKIDVPPLRMKRFVDPKARENFVEVIQWLIEETRKL
jgi:hypothetical protein